LFREFNQLALFVEVKNVHAAARTELFGLATQLLHGFAAQTELCALFVSLNCQVLLLEDDSADAVVQVNFELDERNAQI